MRRASLLLTVLACGCGSSEEEKEHVAPARTRGAAIVIKPEERAALDLAVTPATEGELPEVRIRYGRIITRPGDEVAVAAPFAGRITSIAKAAIGDAVETGTELATISPVLAAAERANLGVQAAELRGQIDQAERELALKQTELARARDLAKDGIVSQAKLQEAETAFATAQVKLRAVRQGSAAQAGATGRPTALKAPIGGTLVTLDAVVGAGVDSGAVVARILRQGARRVDVATSPTDPIGASYEVETPGGWRTARLVARGTTAGADGSRHDVLELDGDSATLVGATVAVRVAGAAERGVLVPDAAVLPSASGEVIYVERKPGEFEPRTIRVAARFAGKVRVVSGVKAGEPVVIRGAAALRGEALRESLGGDDD
jgi:cobalt-zinc-cadmium efflux system membrane fusion protein